MGDRANVYIRNNNDHGVYLYTHWGGSNLPETVRAALARSQGRWQDDPYLARIIFCEMLGDDTSDWRGTTGYGISAVIGDNEHPIIVVDPNRQALGFAPEPSTVRDRQPMPAEWIPFADVVRSEAFDWPDE